MEFREKQSIYLQIAEYVCEQILLKKWLPGSKILSIRDLAIAMEVTPNTIQRTYDFLTLKQIIANRRGVGYFVEENGIERILTFRREQFVENELPVIFKNMYLLNLCADEFKTRFEEYVKQNFKENNHET
jgi:GntR family transcriptional regulator